MGPSQHALNSDSDQEGAVGGSRKWLGRLRRCLLKGCERYFRPLHPCCRYCSEDCSRGARRWSRWRAARRYRRTEGGRERRREQCRQYRQRSKERRTSLAEAEECGCEGHHNGSSEQKSFCDRPGCYTLFEISSRSPQQRFCSSLCRQALRAVLVREARWRRNEPAFQRPQAALSWRGP